jgi:hypothetical protein
MLTEIRAIDELIQGVDNGDIENVKQVHRHHILNNERHKVDR